MKLLHPFVFVLLLAGLHFTAAGQNRKTENVILVTLDGMRWQEVITGADSALMKQQNTFKDGALRQKYWHPDVQTRRKMLLPFLWSTVATQGQLWGNRLAGSKVNVTNNQWFSYPGYNEILTGFADNARINSNDKVYNPNTNVLEFIHSIPVYKGKVAAFTSWDVFPYIINDTRNGIPVNSGVKLASGSSMSQTESTLNQLMPYVPNSLGSVRLDAFTFHYGLEYMKRNHPRVMYFAFDETDDFAHAGEYAAYLNSANAVDQFLSTLYAFIQSDTFYKGKTTLIITVDHGRGTNAEDWKHHGAKVAEADQIWMGFLGPDTPADGEVKNVERIYQNQVAQTIAALLGLTYVNSPDPGNPISRVIGK
jgi:hypothetical protein